jgi:hypothetical protein
MRSRQQRNDSTIQRLQWAITAALSSPLLDDIQGFAWEAVFHYAKDLSLRDPLTQGKSKRLFDAVSSRTKEGWSLKAKQCGTAASMRPGMNIDFVIQRADIHSKAKQLGLPEGSLKDPSRVGPAIIRLWNEKVRLDMATQRVKKPKLAVLLKSVDRKHFGYFEIPLPTFDPGRLNWAWVRGEERGLQAREDGVLRLKWYPSGKQLFQCISVPAKCSFFSVEPRRVPMDTFVEFIGKLAYR